MISVLSRCFFIEKVTKLCLKGDDIMNLRSIKIWMIALALVFATQGCAVILPDRGYDHHHRRYDHHPRHHHRGYRSSVEQSPQLMAQSVDQNGEYSGDQQQVAR
jgi:hypothetical protein